MLSSVGLKIASGIMAICRPAILVGIGYCVSQAILAVDNAKYWTELPFDDDGCLDVISPDDEDVTLDDVEFASSMVCRFMYSVRPSAYA